MRAAAPKALRFIGGRLLVAAVIAAVIAVATQHGMSPPRPSAQEFVDTASIIQAPTSIGSADSDLYNRSEADIDKTLDTLKAMGVQNVRIVIPWAGVQPFNANTYNWTNVDRMVNAAAARNMGVLAVLNSTPLWASNRYLSGHPDPSVFATFAGAAAARYKGKISAYEVWNEPNAITFWNPVDPVAYTQLLQAGYTAIKAADPSALVVGGVVASLFSAGRITLSPEAFIQKMYAAGAKGYFDALSFHPYNFDGEFSQGVGNLLSPIEQVEDIRQIMVANGDGNLKIWATEYGLPTAEIRPGDVITEQQQADFIEDFLNSWQDVAGAGPLFIYSTRDTSSGDLDIQKNFGFFYTDWTPKLAAYVIADFAGGEVPTETPDHPILDAAAAIARTIINATERVIRAGAQLFAAAVDVTVRVIRGLVDAGVRVVKGIATATVAVISGVIDAITNRLGPDAVTTVAKAAQRVRAPLSVSAKPATEPNSHAADTDSKATAVPQSNKAAHSNKSTKKTGKTAATTSSKNEGGSTELSTASLTPDAKATNSAAADNPASKVGSTP